MLSRHPHETDGDFARRIATELDNGATADIWYDALSYGDNDVADAITYTQEAMQTAARLLRAQYPE